MTNPPTTDEEDDLFNFDNGRYVASPSSSVAVAPPPAAQEPASAPPSQLPLARPVVERVVEPRPVLPAPVVATQVPVQAPRVEVASSRLTRVLLALAVAGNIALVGLVWSSTSGMRSALQEVGEIARRSTVPDTKVAEVKPAAWQELDLKKSVSAEGDTALDVAAEEITRGEYERARGRLYSLLSVIDRFPAGVRSNLAARAQVLVADAYREQADALEREATSVENLGRFLDAKPEEKK